MNKVTPVFPSVLINSMNSLFSQLLVWKHSNPE